MEAAIDKRADDVVVLDMREISLMTDYFVICTSNSRAHTKAIREEVLERVGSEHCLHKEGDPASGWVLLDFGDMIVHIFREKERDYYALDRLWGDAPRLAVERLRDEYSSSVTSKRG